MGKGENVLRELVLEQRDRPWLRASGSWLPRIAEIVTGDQDARKISHAIRRLERAGLVERTEPTRAKPTARGVEVDGILDQITAARGGKFRGRHDAGIDSSESYALR